MNLSTAQIQANWLGYSGVIPFLAAGLLPLDWYQDQILFAIQAYGAIILTFVGAIHWGRALNNNIPSLYILSIIPSLVAWISLLIPANYGLPLLIVSFLIVIIFDYQQYSTLAWFRTLRLRLTLIVSSALLFSWLFNLR